MDVAFILKSSNCGYHFKVFSISMLKTKGFLKTNFPFFSFSRKQFSFYKIWVSKLRVQLNCKSLQLLSLLLLLLLLYHNKGQIQDFSQGGCKPTGCEDSQLTTRKRQWVSSRWAFFFTGIRAGFIINVIRFRLFCTAH